MVIITCILNFPCILSSIVLRPVIINITITPAPNNDSQLLHQFSDTISLTCTAKGGPRIMTRWQFDNGSSVVTVANDSSGVTYDVPSLSTEHTGVYYCEAIIDGMTDTSMNYTLFGEYMYSVVGKFDKFGKSSMVHQTKTIQIITYNYVITYWLIY